MTLITGAWALSASAQQQDVTATYLTNADFSSGTVVDNGICTYGKDMAGNSTTYYGAQAIDGWTNASVGVEADGYSGCAIAGGLFAQGGTPWLGGAGYTAPAGTGNAVGLVAVWGNTIRYTQDVTLPAGSYTVKFRVYNATDASYHSGKFITTNLFGFEEDGGATHYAPNNTFAIGQWSTVAVTFELSAATAGKISMGYVGPGGSGDMPHLFVDNVQILENAFLTDKTSAVNASGWTLPYGNDGFQGTAFNRSDNQSVRMQATYGSSAAGDKIYQSVSGLDNGTYEVVLYAYAMNEWGNNGASLSHDSGTAGYVFAEGSTTVQEWINSRKGTHNADDYGKYTISGVKVTDGTLRVGLAFAESNQTEWYAIQLYSLINTNGVDLSDYAEALQLAVDAANALNGKIPTAGYNAIQDVVTANNQVYTTAEDYQAATAAINSAISTYGFAAMQTAYAEYLAAVAQATQFTTVAVTADTEAQRVTNKAAFDTTMGSISTTVEAVTTDASVITAQLAAIKQAGIDYITGLAPADTTNDFDVTFLITNPNFDSNTNGWTTNTGAQNVGTATNNPFPNPPMWENWKGSGFTGKMSQTITGLPAGKYEFAMYAFVNNLDTENQYIYANDSKANITQTEPKQYVVTDVVVLDGTLEIGLALTSTTANWVQIDQATLKYVGPFADLSPYIDAWKAALATAKTTAATTEKIAPSVLAALQTAIQTYDEGQVDETDQAALEAATAALVDANTLGQKSINSYAIIAQGYVPDDALDGWVCENTNTFHINTWSVEGNPGNDPSGMVTPFIENWVGKGSLLGAGKVYYRLEGLEPGEVYRVEALVRSYNEADATAPNGPNFYVLNDVADLTEVGTTFTYNNMSGIYGTQVAAATIGADGILELGVVIDDTRNYNWVAFKNITISTYDDALAAAVAAVEALNGQVPAGSYASVGQTAIDACQGVNYPTTADAFEQAIADLNAAVATLQPMVEAYAGYLELKDYAEALVAVDNDNATANATLAGVISTAATTVNNATTVTEVTTANSDLRDAMDTYAGAANPVGDGAKFNLSYKFVNGNLEGLPTWTGAAGWYTEQPDGNSQVMTNDAATSEDGTKTAFYEYWSYTAKSNNLFTLYQPVTLPEGTYSMSCYAFAKQQDDPANTGDVVGVYFYANDTQGSSVATDRLTQKTIEFVNATEQEVKIGLKSINPNTYNWMGIGYLELYKIPANVIVLDYDAPMIEAGTDGYDADYEGYDYKLEKAGDVILRRAIKASYNTLVLPFSMTQEEVENVFGQDSKVSVIKAYNAENDVLSFTRQEGILANRPCLLKATQAIDEGTDILIEGRTLVAAGTAYPTTTTDGAQFIGTYEAQTPLQDNDWFVQNGKLVYAETGSVCWVNMTRAYIKLPAASDVKAVKFVFDDEEGEVTGIATIENGQLNILSGKIYDLNGRQVKNPTKGLYIIDGKKVLLK